MVATADGALGWFAAQGLRDEGGFDEGQANILAETLDEGMGETLATVARLEKTEAPLRG